MKLRSYSLASQRQVSIAFGVEQVLRDYNPDRTGRLEELEASLDRTRLFLGKLTEILHKHGRIEDDEVIDLLDYAYEAIYPEDV